MGLAFTNLCAYFLVVCCCSDLLDFECEKLLGAYCGVGGCPRSRLQVLRSGLSCDFGAWWHELAGADYPGHWNGAEEGEAAFGSVVGFEVIESIDRPFLSLASKDKNS